MVGNNELRSLSADVATDGRGRVDDLSMIAARGLNYQAILDAAIGRGWRFNSVGFGDLEGRLEWGCAFESNRVRVEQ